MDFSFQSLMPLSIKKFTHRLIMEKCCGHDNDFIFDQIMIKFTGNQDRHKTSDEFEFQPHLSIYLGVICP